MYVLWKFQIMWAIVDIRIRHFVHQSELLPFQVAAMFLLLGPLNDGLCWLTKLDQNGKKVNKHGHCPDGQWLTSVYKMADSNVVYIMAHMIWNFQGTYI